MFIIPEEEYALPGRGVENKLWELPSPQTLRATWHHVVLAAREHARYTMHAARSTAFIPWVELLISNCDICAAKTRPGHGNLRFPCVHHSQRSVCMYFFFFFLKQVTYFPQVLWMSVMGLGKRGPSSHFEPASQPATQPALEQTSQSFLKGLWFDRIPWGSRGGIRISSCFPSNTGEDTP